MSFKTLSLVGKCSATRCSVAAPPPGARQGFGGPCAPRHPTAGAGERCDRALWGGCSCDTPATLSELNCRMSRDRGVATLWSATGAV